MSASEDTAASRKAATEAAKAQADVIKASKERAAQREREAARAYLEREGCGPGSVELALNKGDDAGIAAANAARTKTTDNTLDLLLRTNALEKAKTAKPADSNAGNQAKSTSTETEKTIVRNVSSSISALPLDWKEVPDPSSGRSYYWNTRTNETSWTRPVGTAAAAPTITTTPAPSSVTAQLPEGWSEHIHPATKQKYYRHTSGKTSATLPTDTTASSDGLKRRAEDALSNDSSKLKKL